MDTAGLHALIAVGLNDFKWALGCRDTAGPHALIAGLNYFK
jgi:hypothetical protein